MTGISPYVLPGLCRNRDKVSPSMLDRTLKVAAEVWGVPEEKILCRTRTRKLVRPRQFSIWYVLTNSFAKLEAVGEAFDRDHSTIINSREKVEAALKGYDPQFNEKIQQAIEILNR